MPLLLRSVRIGAVVLGLAGSVGSVGSCIYHENQIDDLRREMPPSITRAYELERELSADVPVRTALDPNSESTRRYRQLGMELNALMTPDVRQQKDYYDRTLEDYEGYLDLAITAAPLFAVLIPAGIANILAFESDMLYKWIRRKNR